MWPVALNTKREETHAHTVEPEQYILRDITKYAKARLRLLATRTKTTDIKSKQASISETLVH